MPKLDKTFTLEVTPEQFLRNCSKEELLETDLLLQSPYYQKQMNGTYSEAVVNAKLAPKKHSTT